MKSKTVCVPTIIEHLNPVTEQFGPLSLNTNQMQIPDKLQDIPRIINMLLSDAEQAICDTATD
jgi:hypothetical protein